MSRSLLPKQFLPLTGPESLLAATCRRVADAGRFAAPIIVCNDEHRFLVAGQLREAAIEPQAILLEPAPRSTAPAAAVAALLIARADPQMLLLLLTADSHIERPDDFRRAIEAGAAAAAQGRLVTFGVAPTRAETGFGYIRLGAPVEGAPGVQEAAAFLEKPDRATAEAYAAGGQHLWNSGNFLFRVDVLLAELDRLQPALLAACRRALDGATPDLDFLRLDGGGFAAAPTISIDHAVMEKTGRAAVVPTDMGWSDIGSWDALWAAAARDGDGNALTGDVLTEDVRNSYLRSNGRLVAAVGLEDMVVVETDDVIFAAPRGRAAEVKGLVAHLKAAGRPEADSHSTVYRPWGAYRVVDRGDGFQVKRLIVKPGCRLSAQTHRRRAEHWVVVQGTATVTIGAQTRRLGERESVDIPVGTLHRLENAGDRPLHLVEVQTGGYLGEDDIIRHDDDFGRV